MSFRHVRHLSLAFAACTALGATAAPKSDAATAEATYRADRAACLQKADRDERATCLYEAASVRRDALQGRDPGAKQAGNDLQANAYARCDALPADNRADCRVIVGLQLRRDEGTERGVYEMVKIVPLPPGTDAPAQ